VNPAIFNDITKFENSVKNIHEIEYGDFKRKLSLYILRLEQSLGSKNKKSHFYISQMKEKVIYNPEGNIDIARDIILEITKKMSV
jgi:hypothetical protein